MNSSTLRNCLITAAIAAGLATTAARVSGNSVNGLFVDDARCDVIPSQSLSRELGDVASFPAVDAISYHDHRYSTPVGVADDGIANDWTVHMTNVSGQPWKNLFFVADNGATIGNADGMIEDAVNAPGIFTDAFCIDALGSNVALLSESLVADGIFQPGEDWEFAVTNFNTGLNAIPPTLTTPGFFAGSSQLGGIGGGNASILASPVPEPSLAALLLAAGALLARRRR
jgi:hypothetical protein